VDHRHTEPRHLRVAPLGSRPEDGVVLDLGRDGKAVIITRDGWEITPATDHMPPFRRTPTTQALPEPAPGGSLTELRELLNVTDESWPQVVAWLVSALIPGIARPVLLLTGEPCSGKTAAARLLGSLLDPGAPLNPFPDSEEAWESAVDGAWVVGFDHVCRIPGWLADALCLAASGGVTVKRALGRQADVQAQETGRAFILAGTVDPGGIRADLAERTLRAELHHIVGRRPEPDLREAFTRARPRILGALLDVLVSVLAALPQMRAQADDGDVGLPRMADHALVTAALEEAAAGRPV
jgi:hypothetical protein